jgi:hypothetical protein
MSLLRRQFLKLSVGTFTAAAIADKTLALQSIIEMDTTLGDPADRSRRNKEVTKGDPMEGENLGGLLDRTPARKRVTRLKGVRGRIRFETEDGAAYLLGVEDGEVELTTGGDDAQAVVVCDTKALVERLLRGEANLIVETLQGHTDTSGDVALVIKVILELQAGSPFAVGEQNPKKVPL